METKQVKERAVTDQSTIFIRPGYVFDRGGFGGRFDFDNELEDVFLSNGMKRFFIVYESEIDDLDSINIKSFFNKKLINDQHFI